MICLTAIELLLLQQNQMKSKAARSKTSQRLRRGKRQQRRLRQV